MERLLTTISGAGVDMKALSLTNTNPEEGEVLLLVNDLAIGPSALGLLTSTYFIAFASAQLPLGVMLDRFGPRRVEALLLLFAFVASVAYTTVLAAGRRATATVTAATPRLATAGPTGAAPSLAPEAEQLPGAHTLGGLAQGLTWASFLLMAGSLAARAVIVERGPWGNMYEFSIAFAVGILGGVKDRCGR